MTALSNKARRGRKRKLGDRELNGQLSRSTPSEPREDVTAVAKNQPHRLGSTSQARASAVGRLIEDAGYLTKGKSVAGLYEAANRFDGLYRNWQIVMASRRPYANGVAPTGRDIPDDVARQYLEDWHDCRMAISAAQLQVMKTVCADPHGELWQPGEYIVATCIAALIVLARYFGIDIRGEDKRAAA